MKIDAMLVEFTVMCHIDEGDAEYVDRIADVYLLDRNRHVHLCELRPSYALYHLYGNVHFTHVGRQLADDACEALADKYSAPVKNVDYTNISALDRCIAKGTVAYHHVGEIETDDDDYDDTIDELVEHYQANHVL